VKIGPPYPGQPDVTLWVALKHYCWLFRFTMFVRLKIWWLLNRPIVGRCQACRWWALDGFDRGFRQCNYPVQGLWEFREVLFVEPGSIVMNPESESRLVTHSYFGCTRFDPRVGLRQNSEQADAENKARDAFAKALIARLFPKDAKTEGGGS
jgi:hypothetical protein